MTAKVFSVHQVVMSRLRIAGSMPDPTAVAKERQKHSHVPMSSSPVWDVCQQQSLMGIRNIGRETPFGPLLEARASESYPAARGRGGPQILGLAPPLFPEQPFVVRSIATQEPGTSELKATEPSGRAEGQAGFPVWLASRKADCKRTGVWVSVSSDVAAGVRVRGLLPCRGRTPMRVCLGVMRCRKTPTLGLEGLFMRLVVMYSS